MPFKTVAVATLTRAGFSQPAQANSFFPPLNKVDHIHLGVPTTKDGQSAGPGNVLVTFISLKRKGEVDAAGRLAPGPNGDFYLSKMVWRSPWNASNGWEAGWKDELKNALGNMIQP